ncbi:MAG: TonB-dependent receptor [Candidatus Marinimicrobia bacterium]|jgi:outer membrane receptor protein involved in Fe transport|nr:TonB-dependent receptor [Candidatus Neomarinimicrobiota bacterium]
MINSIHSLNAKNIVFQALIGFFLITGIAFPQDIKLLNGYVVDDETDRPLVGANIIIQETTFGTISGEDGSFTLEWEGSFPITLNVSYIGYRHENRIISDQSPVSIRLKSTVLKGEMITIMGTRKPSDRDVSSSVEVVSIRRIEERGIRDVAEVLQEMEAVNVTTTSWGKQHISIRGSNANEVSVYMDGVKMNRAVDGTANLAFVDLSEIAQVEVIRGGASTLFGPGNFGGVVLLHSKKPDKNDFQISRSFGITDKSDQDLGGAILLRAGPLSASGRFSGKSRLYDGRTLHTAFYNNVGADLDFSLIQTTAKRMKIKNTIEYPSGAILSADEMVVDRASIYGEIPFVGEWYAQGGIKTWTWEDNFFSNLSRNLEDITESIKVGKGFSWKNFDGTIQWERESKTYKADQTINDLYSELKWADSGILTQEDNGLASVFRYSVHQPVQGVETIRWELGLRNSSSHYTHNQVIDEYNDTLYIEQTNYNNDSDFSLSTFRVGAYLSGRLGGLDYEIFFNQGTNHRPPTLNDQLLWVTTQQWIENPAEEIGDTKLLKEYVTTSELNVDLIWDNLKTKPISRWKLGVGLFRNYYLDKIVYRPLTKNVVAPSNITRAWINGMEFRWQGRTWDRLFELTTSMTTLFPSDEEVFPNKPSLQGNVMMDVRWRKFRLNMSYMYQGRQSYLIRGIDLQKIDSHRNTNITLSYQRHVWPVDLTVSYTVRNLFSDKVSLVNTAHPDYVNFNYYDAHRSILSFKVSLSAKPEK